MLHNAPWTKTCAFIYIQHIHIIPTFFYYSCCCSGGNIRFVRTMHRGPSNTSHPVNARHATEYMNRSKESAVFPRPSSFNSYINSSKCCRWLLRGRSRSMQSSCDVMGRSMSRISKPSLERMSALIFVSWK